MTDITKVVKRRTSDTVFSKGHRRIILSIEPGDLLGFRLERTKRTYTARIVDLYNVALEWEVNKARRDYDNRVKSLVKSGMTKRQAKSEARKEVHN